MAPCPFRVHLIEPVLSSALHPAESQGGSPMFPNSPFQASRSVHPGGSLTRPDPVSEAVGFPGQITGRLPHLVFTRLYTGFLFSTACWFASRSYNTVCQVAYPRRISPTETTSCYTADQVLPWLTPFSQQVELDIIHGTYFTTITFIRSETSEVKSCKV